MGTSTGYNAPTTPQWSNMKSQVTKFSGKDNLTSNDVKKLIGNYILTTGGKGQITRNDGTIGGSRRSAQKIARNLGEFFSSIGTRGLQETLREANIESLEGKSVNEISCSLLNYLGGSSSTFNEIDARNALSRLMNKLFERATTPDDIEQILNTHSHGVEFYNILLDFFGYYIYENFCRTFYERLSSRVGEDKAKKSLKSILAYIESKLRYKSVDENLSKIDWAGEEGKIFTDRLFEEILEVFGG